MTQWEYFEFQPVTLATSVRFRAVSMLTASALWCSGSMPSRLSAAISFLPFCQ